MPSQPLHPVTIWPPHHGLARCTACGVQRQFHGMSEHPTNQYDHRRDHEFVAETIGDIDPRDMSLRDLIAHTGEIGDNLDVLERLTSPSPDQEVEERETRARVADCRAEMLFRIKASFGVSFDEMAGTLGMQIL